MKTLYPAQDAAAKSHVLRLARGGASLDTSDTGTGKTVVAAMVARNFNHVCIVCPKIVIPSWERELRDMGVEPLFIMNYEKLRTGNTTFVTKAAKTFTWHVPNDTLIIWDEVHKCKSPISQNAAMLIASVSAGLRNLMLSATAAKDPTEMRAIGYALGLHNLNKDTPKLKGWVRWMREYGCRMDPFRKWVAGALKHLVRLNADIYPAHASRVRVSDLPSAFMDNRVITEPLLFSTSTDIKDLYSDTISEMLLGLASGEHKMEPHALTQILRVRQLVEAHKVSDTCQLINDAVDQGFSVAVFVNFTDTVNMFLRNFPDAAVIVGGQSAEERERQVQLFQNDERRVIICNTSAGGVGVSLHDTHGNFPRMSLINPTYNAVDYTQTLGRIYRNGAKSNAIQRVLIASDTIEEEIISIIERKRLQYSTLHDITTPAQTKS